MNNGPKLPGFMKDGQSRKNVNRANHVLASSNPNYRNKDTKSEAEAFEKSLKNRKIIGSIVVSAGLIFALYQGVKTYNNHLNNLRNENIVKVVTLCENNENYAVYQKAILDEIKFLDKELDKRDITEVDQQEIIAKTIDVAVTEIDDWNDINRNNSSDDEMTEIRGGELKQIYTKNEIAGFVQSAMEKTANEAHYDEGCELHIPKK